MFWSTLVLVIAVAVVLGLATGVIGHIWRLMRVAVTLARFDVLLPGEYYERYPIWLQSIRTLTIPIMKRRRGRSVGARLAKALERLGPAYVKVGQFLATCPDMIGVTVAQELGRLKDRLPPVLETPGQTVAGAAPDDQRRSDLISALLNLGYQPAVAARAIDRTRKALPEAPFEQALRQALRSMMKHD